MAANAEKQAHKIDQAIASLIAHPTVSRAAAAIGVGETTLFRWLRKPAFRRRYLETRRQLFMHALGQLERGATAAVATILRSLSAERTADQLKAAKYLLDVSRRGIEVNDLAAQLEELQAVVDELRGNS